MFAKVEVHSYDYIETVVSLTGHSRDVLISMLAKLRANEIAAIEIRDKQMQQIAVKIQLTQEADCVCSASLESFGDFTVSFSQLVFLERFLERWQANGTAEVDHIHIECRNVTNQQLDDLTFCVDEFVNPLSVEDSRAYFEALIREAENGS